MPDKSLFDRWLTDKVVARVWAALLTGGGAFVALVYFINWKVAVALLGFVTLLTFNLYSLQLGILPVFFAIPMDRLGKIGPESVITWAKLLIGVLIIAWAAHVLLGRERRPLSVLLKSPLFWLALLTLGFSFVSVINARDYDIFLAQNVRRMSNVALFVLIVSIMSTKTLVRRALLVFLVAYFFVGLTVLYEIATGNSILSTVWGQEDVALEYTLQSGEFRVGGPGGDPDFLAISVIFPSLVGLSVLLAPVSRLGKLLLIPLLLEMMIALLATGSRGGLGAFLIGVGLIWLFSKVRYKFAIAAGGVSLIIVIAVVLASAGAASTKRYTGESGGKSLIYRWGWTKMALQMIEDHPLVGIGTGNFPRQYNRYSRDIPTVPRKPYWTHNSFLQTWAENGVLAFFTYIALFFTAAGLMLRVIASTRDPELRRLAVLVLSAVAAYFFFAGTSNVLENENYWIVFSLATVVSALAKEEERARGTADGAALPA